MKEKPLLFFTINILLVVSLIALIVLLGTILPRLSMSTLPPGKDRADALYTRTKDESIRNALHMQNALRVLAEERRSAVVNIATETYRGSKRDIPSFENDPLDSYLGKKRDSGVRNVKSLGSGFMIDGKGYLITTLQPLRKVKKILVRFMDDEKEYEAKIVGKDDVTDIALLKISGSARFPFLTLGDSDAISQGDFAFALGNPYGGHHMMSFGIISAKTHATTSPSEGGRYIEVDARINRGNTGGPLLNIKGEVVGINVRDGGRGAGGFALPINRAKRIIETFRDATNKSPGWLGIYPQDIDESLANALDIPAESGIYVGDVVEGSPAAKAGIHEGDIITHVGLDRVNSSFALFNVLQTTPPGEEVVVTLIREGAKMEFVATIEEKPTESDLFQGLQSVEWLGIEVAGINDQLRTHFRLRETERGVIVIRVATNSPAYFYGLNAKDIIKRIDDTTVKTVRDVKRHIANTGEKKSHLFLIKRNRTVIPIRVYNRN